MFWINFVTLLSPDVVAIVVGSIFIQQARSWRCRAESAALWPETQGQVRECRIIEIPLRNRKEYRTTATYEYAVNGTQYRSQRRFFGEEATGGSRSQAEQLHLKYRVGSQVTVYYNPDNPKEAVLELGVHKALGWMTGFGLLFVSMGCLIGAVTAISTLGDCGLLSPRMVPASGSPVWCQRSLQSQP
jgi:hypothetical protein